ncbi:MAG: type IV toxin-antitoxin system AbiEi family antitoxin [Raoultibacter sp.]
MARDIPSWLSGVLEQLELERPELVSVANIDSVGSRVGIKVPGRVIASRLKERGWLLDTPQRGVWEFVPAEMAGPYSSADPLIPLKAFLLVNPTIEYALASQSAAWAHGLADRMPARLEVSFPAAPKVKVPSEIWRSIYCPNLPLARAKGVFVLAPESIAVHMAQRPSAVRSWNSVPEWLPDVAYEMDADKVLAELKGRPASVWARTAYLLSGMRPDVTDKIASVFAPKSKIRFGTTGSTLRNDEQWMVADATLPFDPRKMEKVR